MTKYRVGLVQSVWEECSLTVEAPSRQAAEAKALELALAGDSQCQWSFLETQHESIEIISIDEEAQ